MKPYRSFFAILIALVLVACDSATPTPQPDPNDPGTPNNPDSSASRWTVEQAWGLEQNETNTIPVIDFNSFPRGDQKTLPGYHIWDTWPVRNLDTTVADVDGYRMFIHLSVPDTVLPGKRHDIAQLRYSYSRDGINYTLGGLLFPNATGGQVEGVELGSRNWAGSAIITDDNRVYVYYTATGVKGEDVLPDLTGPTLAQHSLSPQVIEPTSDTYPGYPTTPGISYEQKIAVAYGPTLVATDTGLEIQGEWTHEILLEADGQFYQTQEQADVGPLNAFRDPFVFRDPNDSKIYMLLEGNVGGARKSEQRCANEDIGSEAFRTQLQTEGVVIPPEAPYYNGSIGLAASVNDSLTDFELRPALVTATCVNQELERPHFVFKDGRYYLFTASHIGKFAPIGNLQEKGAEGLYGFVSDTIDGDYQPLNGHGLVLANPEEQPFQAYSYDVLPVNFDGTNRYFVTSFVDYPNTQDINAVGNLPPEEQLAGFGGTLAPTNEIAIEDNTTRLVNTFGFGELPTVNAP
jgi:levansucrase